MKGFHVPYTVVRGVGKGWTYIMQGERLAFLSPPGDLPYGAEEAQVAAFLLNENQQKEQERAEGANEVEAGQTEERT